MALDVREISLLADYFVICSGNSASERAFYNLEKLWSDAPLVDLNEWVVA